MKKRIAVCFFLLLIIFIGTSESIISIDSKEKKILSLRYKCGDIKKEVYLELLKNLVDKREYNRIKKNLPK